MYKETSGLWSDVLRVYKLSLLYSQQEGKLKISNFSYIHQKIEVRGQTTVRKIGEIDTENYSLPATEVYH